MEPGSLTEIKPERARSPAINAQTRSPLDHMLLARTF